MKFPVAPSSPNPLLSSNWDMVNSSLTPLLFPSPSRRTQYEDPVCYSLMSSGSVQRRPSLTLSSAPLLSILYLFSFSHFLTSIFFCPPPFPRSLTLSVSSLCLFSLSICLLSLSPFSLSPLSLSHRQSHFVPYYYIYSISSQFYIMSTLLT